MLIQKYEWLVFKRLHLKFKNCPSIVLFCNIINSLRAFTFSTHSLLTDISGSLRIIGKVLCLFTTSLRCIFFLMGGLHYLIHYESSSTQFLEIKNQPIFWKPGETRPCHRGEKRFKFYLCSLGLSMDCISYLEQQQKKDLTQTVHLLLEIE